MRIQATRFAFAAVFFAIAIGCEQDPSGPIDESFPITTDRRAYQAEVVGTAGVITFYGFTVMAEFRNTTGDTVYLKMCRPGDPAPMFFVAVLTSDDQWGAAYNELWGCSEHGGHQAVPPGETRVHELEVWGPRATEHGTHTPLGVFEGSFRISYEDRACQGPDNCPPGTEEQTFLSNSFDVSLASDTQRHSPDFGIFWNVRP